MPVIVKTPLRISLFGGGTDYKEYFERSGGAVLGGTIDKFIYIVCLPMSPVAETRYRLTYSRVEAIDRVGDIQHPVIREVLKDEGYDIPFNLAVISDIPGGSGLGSSSAFTVGFVNFRRPSPIWPAPPFVSKASSCGNASVCRTSTMRPLAVFRCMSSRRTTLQSRRSR